MPSGMPRLKPLLAAALSAAALLCAPLPATAQEADAVRSPVMILNQERLISQSLYGRRIEEEVEATTRALGAENRRIEAQLSAEELALTEQRDTMAPADFRVLADEFDIRVEGIRAAQQAKAREIQTQAEAAQSRFFEEAFPILLEIVRARGGQVLMDSRTVLISASGIDITEEAIARIDAELGNGGAEPLIFLPGLSDTGDAGSETPSDGGGEPDLPVLDLDQDAPAQQD